MRYFTVNLALDSYEASKVPAIKVAIMVFGFGLKEAKDFCDDWYDKYGVISQRVILNERQVGIFLIERTLNKDKTIWDIYNIEQFEKETLKDLSHIGSNK